MSNHSNFGVVALQAQREMTGLDVLRGMRDGTQPAAQISQLLGFTLVEVEPDRVVFEARPAAAHLNPLGTVHGGYAATLLDSCMGCAIHTRLHAGQSYTTLELKVNYIRAILPDSGVLRAEGRVIHTGRRVATSDGRIVDVAGKLYAHGSTTCMIFDSAGG